MTTSGAFYTITFFLVMSGGPPNSFSVSWGGVTLLSLTDHQQPFDYTEFTFNVPASDSSTELLFQFNTTGFPADGVWLLDDVSVVPMLAQH